MRIIAIDPSLTSTGLATWRAGTIEAYTIQVSTRGPERLDDILHGVTSIPAPWVTELVLIEGYAHGRSNQAHQLGELGGVLRHWFFREGVPIVEVPPSTRAKLATGKGNAGKEEVLASAIRRLGYEGHSPDEADALWILQCALVHYGLPGAADLPRSHRDALKKLTFPELEFKA